jgi:putative ABC transport system substrate-binding protein
VAWPLVAQAQQTMPVLGVLSTRGPDDAPQLTEAFHQGLKDAGFVDGQNVQIEYRFAMHRNERLPTLAADLVHRKVTMIAALSTPSGFAAKAATTSIPIVFTTAGDPVRLGLVSSLNRPGGNITGATQMAAQVVPKRLELLHELIPSARVIALLINPTNRGIAESNTDAVLAATRSLGLELRVLNASSESDFDSTFASVARTQAGGLVIAGDPFFTSRQQQLAALAVRHAVPTVYENREFVAAGGLMSYGSSVADAYRLAGIYTGRVLKGEKPANLPVQQTTKVELLINLKSAKALGITVPLPLSGRADELIE